MMGSGPSVLPGEILSSEEPKMCHVETDRPERRLILLTGATGYVGGRLLKSLEAGGYHVRCLARHPEVLEAKVASTTEVFRGDVLETQSLRQAMSQVHTAFYLVHSMGIGKNFEAEDRKAARNFGQAAREASVQRILYLGGLGEDSPRLSPHLRSRHEVGDILRESGVQVIEFRASVIIGSGSLSFEMIRSLVERLPVMITPRWVSVAAQPIAINDVLDYLMAALDLPVGGNRIFEIGGADQVSYGELMREYARQRRLRRVMIPVPVLTPRLSSLWLGLVTPLYAHVGRFLIDSIRYPSLVHDQSALEVFAIRPKGIREAISDGLEDEDHEFTETQWSDVWSRMRATGKGKTQRFGTRIVDSRTVQVNTSAEIAFRPVRRIGGDTGWYYGNWLWRVRGFLDILVGGVGMRRGRRDPDWLNIGDAVDCWRVEAFEPPRLLRFVAEMRLPGRAWLQFEVQEVEGKSTICQTAIFDPLGLCGLAYWYALLPLHKLVFAGMLRGIALASRSQNENPQTGGA